MQRPRLTHDKHDGPYDPEASPPTSYGKYKQRLYELPEARKRKKKVNIRKQLRRPRTFIIFNGKRVSVRKPLWRYPKLRKHLLRVKTTLADSVLEAKLRKMYKAGQIPPDLVDRESVIVQDMSRHIEGDDTLYS